MKKSTAIFLDRDGTINEEVGYLDHLDKLIIFEAAYDAIRLINQSSMKAIVITNQAGVAKGLFSEEFVQRTNKQLQDTLNKRKAVIDKFYYCPHHPTEGKGIYKQVCNCRKPAAGLLLQAAKEMNIDLTHSYLIGDKYRDIETIKKVGGKGILVKTGHGRNELQEVPPEKINAQSRPDFVAEDILKAVEWILEDRM